MSPYHIPQQQESKRWTPVDLLSRQPPRRSCADRDWSAGTGSGAKVISGNGGRQAEEDRDLLFGRTQVTVRVTLSVRVPAMSVNRLHWHQAKNITVAVSTAELDFGGCLFFLTAPYLLLPSYLRQLARCESSTHHTTSPAT